MFKILFNSHGNEFKKNIFPDCVALTQECDLLHMPPEHTHAHTRTHTHTPLKRELGNVVRALGKQRQSKRTNTEPINHDSLT